MPKIDVYIENASISLPWHEHIRKRPGMYIGSVNTHGLFSIIKELITGCVLGSSVAEVKLNLNNHNSGKLTIYADAIVANPFWEIPFQPTKASAEFGLMVLAALSATFELHLLNKAKTPIESFRFQNGEIQNARTLKGANTFAGIRLDFCLDSTVWGDRFQLTPDFMSQQLREYAYLNANTKFELLYKKEGEDCRVIYQYPNGLQHYLEYIALDGFGEAILKTTFTCNADDFTLDVAFAFRKYSVDRAELKSYANNVYTFWEGSHVQGLFMGIANALRRYQSEHQIMGDYDLSEENLRKTLIGCISVVLEVPLFAGATKSKLANEEVVSPISERVAQHFYARLIGDEANTKYFFQYDLARKTV